MGGIKAEGQAVLVVYIIVSAIVAAAMLFGWCAHSWYTEDRFILCKSYEKYYYNKKLDKEMNK